MAGESAAGCVCVTGGSGFIASHVVRELLERGHTVRTTVRDAEDEEKTAHLRKLGEAAPGRIAIMSADLLEPGSYDAAIAGCDAVCHVAAVARMASPNPQRDIVDPSIEGARNVYQSIVRAGTVKRVVHTSSIAAIARYAESQNHVFTEQDWNTEATLKTNPYGFAKTEAERFAWSFRESLPEAERFDLITINPCLVIGPVFTRRHTKASPTVVRDLLSGAFPACPQFHFSIVDVREVARAHAEALARKDASGRYILAHEGRWMREMGQALQSYYPQLKIPTRNLPNFLMYIAAIFDKRLSFPVLRRLIGNVTEFENRRSREELGIQYRSIDETLKDCADSMLEQGFIKTRKR